MSNTPNVSIANYHHLQIIRKFLYFFSFHLQVVKVKQRNWGKCFANSIPICSFRILWVIELLLNKEGWHWTSFESLRHSRRVHLTIAKSLYQSLKSTKRWHALKHLTLYVNFFTLFLMNKEDEPLILPNQTQEQVFYLPVQVFYPLLYFTQLKYNHFQL